ncbi:MAG: hypothetical protein MJA29_10145 [Candidatus Omnitrophica bacterium]|nr:hypothetical protein [Candidatus Omnitrophota bacterium]
MRAFLLTGLVGVTVLLAPLPVKAFKSEKDFFQGEQAARRGDIDGAFMHFRSVVMGEAEQLYYGQALFAVGEYYYLKGVYTEAVKSFTQFVKNDPRSEARIFALAYLMKIAEFQERDSLAEILRHQIATFRQVSLLFRDSREFEYLSCLQRNLKVVYYIDKVEFYVNEELFTRIPY